MTRSRYYLGHVGKTTYELFRSTTEPTHATHGSLYSHTIGPFRTLRGARFMRENPHCVTVRDAERLARET